MQDTRQLKFESPSFITRIKGMLGVDFYRLFHTPLFYIFLIIAAVIPAMILGTMGMENPQTGEIAPALYTNTWQIIAAETPIYVINNIAEYANMNMVFIFGGIMVSIFIGHDYKSGYVKQLFTTHAKKEDYMISKSLTCAFAMACMCILSKWMSRSSPPTHTPDTSDGVKPMNQPSELLFVVPVLPPISAVML